MKALTFPQPQPVDQTSSSKLTGQVLDLLTMLEQETVRVGSDTTLSLLSAARDADLAIAKLTERIAELEQTAATDDLTGILNRRGFERAFERIIAAANRYNETGVLIYVDLDDFKPVNDRFGHTAGDAVLVRVAELLVAQTRDTDAAARLGGDEFAVLLTRTNREDGHRRAETLDFELNQARVPWQGRVIPVRASLGFQPFGPGDDARSVLIKADQAMYAAKEVRTSNEAKQHSTCDAKSDPGTDGA